MQTTFIFYQSITMDMTAICTGITQFSGVSSKTNEPFKITKVGLVIDYEKHEFLLSKDLEKQFETGLLDQYKGDITPIEVFATMFLSKRRFISELVVSKIVPKK